MKIEASNLASTIEKFLEEYADDADEVLENAVAKVAKESVSDLKKGGNYVTHDNSKYTGAWKNKKESSRTGATAIVYNSKSPGLAHLLEFGHAKRNGGRTRSFPHIAPVNEKVEERMLNYLESNL